MYSTRVPSDRHANRLTRAVAAARAAGREPIDLTVTNPTLVGIDYPRGLLEPLASPAALVYTPAPFGLPAARDAVARDYRRRGMTLDSARIVLTASTSEAYSLLFKLLCDPGDVVLTPSPSYPLFDHLTRLDSVMARSYHLEYHGRWSLDTASVDVAWRGRVRAVLGVSPNNPTGSILTASELRALGDRCAERGAALILDEVFADYPLNTVEQDAATRPPRALTFRLGGLAKSAGLPQVKLGWIAVEGPAPLVENALDRLELISDTYLSVSTPVQIAAAALMEAGAGVRAQIASRVAGNVADLCRQAQSYPAVDVLRPEAGWSAVVRVPSTRSEEDLVVDLIERDDVLVHPGFFFDFPHETFVVVSLLPEPGLFSEGVRRLMERAGG